MDFNKLIERVKAILLSPNSEWPVIAAESTTVADLYRNYIIVLAAIPAIFGFIKGSLIGIDLPMLGTIRVGFGAGLTGMLLGYALGLAQVYLVALIVDALAPTFGAQKNLLQALKLAAYAFTAAWIAGLAQILPWIGALIGLLGGGYSIYLLYLGLPTMMQCPADKAVGYTVVTLIAAIVLSLIIGVAVSFITGGSAPGQVGSADIQYDPDSPVGKLNDWTQKMERASKQVEAARESGDASAQSEAMGNMLGAVLGGGKVAALSPDQLKEFIPESLADLPRTDISAELNGAMGMQISQADATFADDNGRSLQLQITDTGSAKGLLALAGFASLQNDEQNANGFNKTYKSGGRLVHEEWDNGGRGEYALVVADRFTIKVSGDAADIDELKDAVNEIDVDRLDAMKDTGVGEE